MNQPIHFMNCNFELKFSKSIKFNEDKENLKFPQHFSIARSVYLTSMHLGNIIILSEEEEKEEEEKSKMKPRKRKKFEKRKENHSCDNISY